jgi:hypothetical protein
MGFSSMLKGRGSRDRVESSKGKKIWSRDLEEKESKTEGLPGV